AREIRGLESRLWSAGPSVCEVLRDARASQNGVCPAHVAVVVVRAQRIDLSVRQIAFATDGTSPFLDESEDRQRSRDRQVEALGKTPQRNRKLDVRKRARVGRKSGVLIAHDEGALLQRIEIVERRRRTGHRRAQTKAARLQLLRT